MTEYLKYVGAFLLPLLMILVMVCLDRVRENATFRAEASERDVNPNEVAVFHLRQIRGDLRMIVWMNAAVLFAVLATLALK